MVRRKTVKSKNDLLSIQYAAVCDARAKVCDAQTALASAEADYKQSAVLLFNERADRLGLLHLPPAELEAAIDAIDAIVASNPSITLLNSGGSVVPGTVHVTVTAGRNLQGANQLTVKSAGLIFDRSKAKWAGDCTQQNLSALLAAFGTGKVSVDGEPRGRIHQPAASAAQTVPPTRSGSPHDVSGNDNSGEGAASGDDPQKPLEDESAPPAIPYKKRF
jgi:hypothetical protein